MSNNGYNADNFKRNAKSENQDGDDAEPAPNEKVQEYTKELLAEKLKLESTTFPHSVRLLDQEIENSRTMNRPPKDNRYADLYHDKLVKVDVKVLIPVKDHPRFNFVGKLLGPKGNNMKKLKEETMCKISVFGKGSIRDKQKEDELRNSMDPKYAHLSEELHVGISALAPPAEAYARIAYALAEVRKYMVPDNDPIQDQMGYGGQPPPFRMPPPPPMGRGPPVGPPPPRGPGGPMRGGPGGRKGPGGKANVLSILDRARASMEESYGFTDAYDAPPPPPRHLLEDPYNAYYDESAQGGDFYRDTPAPDNNSFYGGGQAGGSRPPFKGPRAAAGGRQGGGRQFNRPAPYNRPGK